MIKKNMLESILIILLVIAVILLVLSIEWQSISITTIDVILWLVLGISIYSIDIPYQYIIDNTVMESTQHVTDVYPISYLFMGIGIIMMIYLFLLGFDLLKGKVYKIM
jgi:hypothetical protein